jgi:translation initiation factor SUI1
MDFNESDINTLKQKQVNIRLKQRNGKKCHTFIEDLFEEIEDEDELKKMFNKLSSKLKAAGCGGSVIKDEETQKLVIMLNGDHCERVKQYLINQKLYTETEITLHGF